MKFAVSLIFCLMFGLSITFAQSQSPEAFLGYTLGERFTPHYRVVDYFEHVAEQNDNIRLERYGESVEHRPLMVAYLTAPENFAQLDEIRKANLSRTGLIDSASGFDDVAIVWLSYNVHGNESVSTEAVMRVLYQLADKNNTRTQAWLKNTVVILDPCINPDGRDRYVHWYNQKVNNPPNASPDSWEHDEPWPGGRMNHYLFDLNRDWAWATQQETRARLKLYNQWLPHVHADYHEQGINSPYYFAPAAEPFHALITDWQREFQTTIGQNNAQYFDSAGWLYFTRERFDLLYPSYGDTYPTYNGAIGMTYEQGGSGAAGLAVLTEEGDTLTLKDRIAHHVTTSLATIESTAQNAARVVQEFQQFYQNALQNPPGEYQSFVVKTGENADKRRALTDLLDTHRIRYGVSEQGRSLSGFGYQRGNSGNFSLEAGDLIIPVRQPKAMLTQILFEPITDLSDSITYDITAWSLPYAYGLDAYATTEALSVEDDNETVATFTPNQVQEPAYAYVSEWKSVEDAKFLAQLLKEKIKVRYALRDFEVEGNTFAAGSLIIPRANNRSLGQGFDSAVVNSANRLEKPLTAVSTGFVSSGFDVGSGEVRYIEPPKVLLATGDDVSPYGFGEVWYFFEKVINYPVTVVKSDLKNVDLSDYHVLIMPDGSYDKVAENKELLDWVSQGGKIIALEGALSDWKDAEGLDLKEYADEGEKKDAEVVKKTYREAHQLAPYEARERRDISQEISGAIFRVKLDDTHPLGFGYSDTYYTLKRGAEHYGYLADGWNVGTIPGQEALVSGFAGAEAQKNLAESLVFGVEEKGRGNLVYMVDNPLFRAFWYNGQLLFANAVFLVGQ